MSSDKKQELFGIKLKNAILIGKKATKTTPSPTWKLGFSNSSSINPNFPMKTSVSARKIGANLWEVQPQFNFIKTDGDRDQDHDCAGGASSLNHRQRHWRHHSYDKKGFKVSDQFEEPFDDNSQPPDIATNLTKNIRGFPSLRNISVGKDDQHLLKILDRIWNLEEQHVSNVASIKALKRELDNSRAQIKMLLEERKTDHQELDELKKSTNDRRKKTIESTKNELSDIKASFLREKKARILLESLCDEFAKGIRDYEQKARFLLQTYGKEDPTVNKNEPDRLILHVSEAWLDERTQMKSDFSEKTSISENLCCEIETFLEAKKKQLRGSGDEENRSCGVVIEPCSHLVSRMMDHGPIAGEPSSGLACEGIKANTLMAKLIEARLESQFSKSRTIRR